MAYEQPNMIAYVFGTTAIVKFVRTYVASPFHVVPYQEDTNYTQSLQQHSALLAIRMHTIKKKKKNTKKEKSRYSDQFLVTAAQTPPRQH
jgi:hypothetical protein